MYKVHVFATLLVCGVHGGVHGGVQVLCSCGVFPDEIRKWLTVGWSGW